MALAYHPVIWTGNRPEVNADYYDGSTNSRAIDYPGNRLYRWVYTNRVVPADAGAGNHYYDYYHTINPSYTTYAQPTSEYQSAELVVFDMNTRTEIHRWTFPSLWAQFTSVSINSQSTAEANAHYTTAGGSSYTAATVYDIGFDWASYRYPGFVQGVYPLEGSSWVVSDLAVFQHIDSPRSGVANPGPPAPDNKTHWIRYLLAVDATTGESVLYQAPWDERNRWIDGVVKVSSSKYAIVSALPNLNSYNVATDSKIQTYVFDTTTKTWSHPSAITTGGYVAPSDDYWGGGRWAFAAKNGTSGGSYYAIHRLLTDSPKQKRLCIARVDLNSSGQPTAFVPLTSMLFANNSNVAHLSYIDSDDTIIFNRVEESPSTVSAWYKLNGTTGSTIVTNSMTGVDSNPIVDTNSKYGNNIFHANPPFENQYDSGYLLAATGNYQTHINSRPHTVSTADLSVAAWSVFATDWVELDATLGMDSYDMSRSGIWVGYNPDPVVLDFWSMDWTLVTHATPPPTMGLCFLEETDSAYKDFQDRYPD